MEKLAKKHKKAIQNKLSSHKLEDIITKRNNTPEGFLTYCNPSLKNLKSNY